MTEEIKKVFVIEVSFGKPLSFSLLNPKAYLDIKKCEEDNTLIVSKFKKIPGDHVYFRMRELDIWK